MTAQQQVDSSYGRLRAALATRALMEGLIEIPLRCQHCDSATMASSEEAGMIACVSCGRLTNIAEAHNVRRVALRDRIKEGLSPGEYRRLRIAIQGRQAKRARA